METNVVELRGHVNEYKPAQFPTDAKEVGAIIELTTSLILPSHKPTFFETMPSTFSLASSKVLFLQSR